MNPELNEPILSDDYNVFAGYYYVVNDKPICSDITGTVEILKRYLGATEIRRCDIIGRMEQQEKLKEAKAKKEAEEKFNNFANGIQPERERGKSSKKDKKKRKKPSKETPPIWNRSQL